MTITDSDIKLVKSCLEYAIGKGVNGIRISLHKEISDSCASRNGKLDKVTHSADSTIYFYIFANGRFGNYSTNRFEYNSLTKFIDAAIARTIIIEEDPYRSLPDPERVCKTAKTGLELDLYDKEYPLLNNEKRLEIVHRLSAGLSEAAQKNSDKGKSIGEECEFTDTIHDAYIIDSQGLECRHIETYFTCVSEYTVQDDKGNKYSGYWYDSSTRLNQLNFDENPSKAVEKAIKQIGPIKYKSGKYKMVVDNCISPALVSPIINALNAAGIQQNLSFLKDSRGKKLFPESMCLIDKPTEKGKLGSILYDSEGVALKERTLIENGVVKDYLVNTYMAKKMGIEPTVDDVTRPCLLQKGEKSVSLGELFEKCGEGIYVTSFNGGNCNPVTGDFSYGIEGFIIENGKLTKPVREMLITGNILELWNELIAIANDTRPCIRWQIPSVAFDNVSFSA